MGKCKALFTQTGKESLTVMYVTTHLCALMRGHLTIQLCPGTPQWN